MRWPNPCVVTACAAVVFALGTSCSTSPEEDEVPPGLPAAVVRTNGNATIQHSDGWAVHIPVGAVAATSLGEPGEMLVSVEVDDPVAFGIPTTPPAGWSMVGSAAEIGPEWFTLANPVTVTAPIPGFVDVGAFDVCLCAYDRPAARWVVLAGCTDAAAGLVQTNVLRLGVYMVMARPVATHGWGAFVFDTIADYQFHLSVESFQIGYFPEDVAFDPSWCHAVIPSSQNENGPVAGRCFVEVPQGIYQLALGVYHATDPQATAGSYLGYATIRVTIAEPHYDWTAAEHQDHARAVSGGDLTVWTDPENREAGDQPSIPDPTPTVGIGALNVRLEWAAPADLDLWVVDPCGNRIWGGAREASCNDALGRLDLDNQCSRLVLGKPENIYWTAPPRGTYTVYLDYYEDCGGAARIPYTLRWMVSGTVQALHGWILPPEWAGVVGDEVQVVEFRY